jgi:hypothetical protein
MTILPDGAPAPDDLHCFQITADLCPQALLRILGLVAQLTLIPRSVSCERHDDRLHARLAIDGLSPERAGILLAKISMIVTVREALLMPF